MCSEKNTMDSIRVRTMTRMDAEAVAKIERQCFFDPWSEGAFQDAMRQRSYSFLVLEVAGEYVVGYIGLQASEQEGDITRIALLPEYRGFGYGGQLMQAMLAWCECLGLKHVFLEVRASNHIAQGLYQKYGFENVGVRKGYYRNPKEDAVIMRK
ncbi:MAG: ribosomal protein S18-alanine N-acetyltransferase [Lachnospiraceae bacterium]